MTFTPLTRAGLVIGLGIGGFFDGIVLHQILQWHHLVCFTPDCQPTSVEMLKRQNTQDGYFHLAVWMLTILGTLLLFRAARQPDTPWTGKAFGGSVLAGWGTFNFVEGLVDHQILGIHHVLPGPHQFAADMAFLGSGLLLAVGGWLLASAGGAEPPDRQAEAVTVSA
jgi:uncharacterized membrane protein